MTKRSLAICLILIALDLVAVIPFSSSYGITDNTTLSNHYNPIAAPGTNRIVMNNQIASAGTNVTLPELFNRVKDSIVEINVIGEIPNHQVIVNDTPIGQPFTGSGSGFVYDKEGRIVTNYHVIQNSKVVFVRFLDGNSSLANITGSDLYSDLAVLTLDPVALSSRVM